MRINLPFYIPFMTIVTAAYLTIEVPFSVHLVEVMGGNPTQLDIDNMESFGRVLTGIAASIWVIGVFVFPWLHKRSYPIITSLVVVAGISAAITSGTYVLLDFVAYSTGSNASGATRKEAFLSNIAKRYIAENGVGDLEFSGDNDWNTFISVVPMLSSSTELLKATGLSAETLAEKEAQRIFGDSTKFRDTLFDEGFKDVKPSFDRYTDGSRRYISARNELDRRASDAWSDFQSELRKKYPRGLPGRGWDHAAIVRYVKFELHLPVREGWSIGDRGEFVRAYKQVAAKEIEERYTRSVEGEFGSGARFPIDLGYDAFVAHPLIQSRIRKAMDLPKSGGTISEKMSDTSFRQEIYNRKLADLTRDMTKATNAPADDFVSGDFARFGVDAVKATRLPAMAILLSIAGAALHIFKFSGYLSQLFGIFARIPSFAHGISRHIFGGAIVFSVFAAMVVSGNAITSTTAYSSLKSHGIYASLLDGAISIQPQFSTVGRFIGSIGGWQAFAADMPPASPIRHIADAGSSAGSPAESDLGLSTGIIPIPQSRP